MLSTLKVDICVCVNDGVAVLVGEGLLLLELHVLCDSELRTL